MQKEKFQNIVYLGLQRWLNSVNLDANSAFFGIADREYWAWKTKDFANGSWQAGLSGFLDLHHLLKWNISKVKKVVEAVVTGSASIQRSNGSFEEAYPLESSVCVTALVIFNLAYSLLEYPKLFSKKAQDKLKNILAKGLAFLDSTPETHGVISNHIATIEFAKCLAKKALGQEFDCKALCKFFETQNTEGWFVEYFGADAGYQTLLLHYCIVGIKSLNMVGFEKEIDRALKFVKKFTFPDCSFAGELGSRGTSIFYPSCSVVDKNTSQWFINEHLESLECVNPCNMDSNNFVPVFNSWAYFYKNYSDSQSKAAIKLKPFEYLKEAGLIFYNTDKARVVISLNTGAIKLLSLKEDVWVDESISSFQKGILTTQGIKVINSKVTDKYTSFEYQQNQRNEMSNGLLKAIAIRLASVLSYYVPAFQSLMKKLLVKFVMMRKMPIPSGIKVKVIVNSKGARIEIENPNKWEISRAGYHAHMASANTFKLNNVS